MRTPSEYNEEIERLKNEIVMIDANEMAKNDYYYKMGREHSEEEGYKMSAELEWYKRFVDHIRRNVMNEEDYREACRFILSEDDR